VCRPELYRLRHVQIIDVLDGPSGNPAARRWRRDARYNWIHLRRRERPQQSCRRLLR